MRVNRLKIETWDVETFRGETFVSAETFRSEQSAAYAVMAGKTNGLGVTCIARNRLGEGRLVELAFVPAIAKAKGE